MPLSIIHQCFNYASHQEFSCDADLLSATTKWPTQHDTAVAVLQTEWLLKLFAFLDSYKRFFLSFIFAAADLKSRKKKKFRTSPLFCVGVLSCLFHFIRHIIWFWLLCSSPFLHPFHRPLLFLSQGSFFQKSTEPKENSDLGIPCKFMFYVLSPFIFSSRLTHFFLWALDFCFVL